MSDLFRQEVLEHKKVSSWQGDTALPNTFSLKIFLIILLIILTGIISLLFFGSYTERRTVSGYLTPIQGLVKVTSSNSGVVSKVYVKEGENVNANQSLLILQSQQYGQLGDYNSQIKKNLEDRLSVINIQPTLVDKDYGERKNIAIEAINDLDTKKKINLEQIALLKGKILISETNYKNYNQALAEGAVSVLEIQTVKEKLIELNTQLNSLIENNKSLDSQIQTKVLEIKQLELQKQKELNDIKTQKSSINQSLLEVEKQITTIIKSPTSGKVTALNVQSNQLINQSKLLLSIIPSDSILKANLLVPPSDIGFIKVGDSVSIRYDAFPYQKYGQAKGKIISISKTTINPTDILDVGGVNLTSQNNKPFYLVDVALDNQYFNVDGTKKSLATGMTFTADIRLENRKLYQWILDPLLSLRERNK